MITKQADARRTAVVKFRSPLMTVTVTVTVFSRTLGPVLVAALVKQRWQGVALVDQLGFWDTDRLLLP